MCAASSSRRRVTGLALYAFSVGLGVQLSLNTFFGAIVYYEVSLGYALIPSALSNLYLNCGAVKVWQRGATAYHLRLLCSVATSISGRQLAGRLRVIAPFRATAGCGVEYLLLRGERAAYGSCAVCHRA